MFEVSCEEYDKPIHSSRLRGLSCHHTTMYQPKRKTSPGIKIKQQFSQDYVVSLTVYYEREHESSFEIN
jgi:hypothetical protein